ncbi:MAG: RBBP9/YdeN family alpha/beta hydrolase [Candidatus Nanopelagicales bacterium]
MTQQPVSQRFLILHGLTNRRPECHWERRLAAALRRAGHVVAYPQLPDTDSPDLGTWLEVVAADLEILEEAVEPGTPSPLTVVAHSLGAVTWLHGVARGLPVRPDRVLLVAPAGPDELEDAAAGFALRPSLGSPTREQVAASAGSTLLVWSGDDEWCAAGVDVVFGEPLGVPIVTVPGGGHLALGDGFGEWPDVVAWALSGEAAWPTGG